MMARRNIEQLERKISVKTMETTRQDLEMKVSRWKKDKRISVRR